MQKKLRYPATAGIYLFWEFTEWCYLRLHKTTKGGSRNGLYQYNNYTQGNVGTRADCDHDKKRKAIEFALDINNKHLYDEFIDKRKERSRRNIAASWENRKAAAIAA